MYQSYKNILENLSEYPDTFKGRGIVTAGGGEKYFVPAWVEIHLLRELGCKLPIELWYMGKNEMTSKIEAALAPLNVVCKDALKLSKVKGWEVKPFSIIHSQFKEILFLDSDNVPTRDPTFLFDTPQYEVNGAIFWPDYETRTIGATDKLLRSKIWEILKLPPTGPAFESGQIVVDKKRCWDALQVTMHFNENSDYYYKFIHGDKDTFLLGWLSVGKEYAMMRPLRPGHHVMYQHDPNGKLLFQHRYGEKWNLNYNPYLAGFKHQDECISYVDDLKTLFRSRNKTHPEYKEICRVKKFNLIDKDRQQYIHLLTDGTASGSGEEKIWDIVEGDEPILTICKSNFAEIYKLTKSKDGIWRSTDIELIPIKIPIL